MSISGKCAYYVINSVCKSITICDDMNEVVNYFSDLSGCDFETVDELTNYICEYNYGFIDFTNNKKKH